MDDCLACDINTQTVSALRRADSESLLASPSGDVVQAVISKHQVDIKAQMNQITFTHSLQKHKFEEHIWPSESLCLKIRFVPSSDISG